jgi:hypothetical protein
VIYRDSVFPKNDNTPGSRLKIANAPEAFWWFNVMSGLDKSPEPRREINMRVHAPFMPVFRAKVHALTAVTALTATNS